VKNIIEIQNLTVEYKIKEGLVHALTGVELHIQKGEAIAIVGESGCGKSTLASALINLVALNAVKSGTVKINDMEILSAGKKVLENIRGKEIGIIFQEAGAALNPVFTVKEQIEETITAHFGKLEKPELEKRGLALLEETGLNDRERIYKAYPHQLSGGQQQRVMIAIALSCNPEILIADEPTTALDVTVQAQIMALLKKLKKDRNLTLILITHDLHLAVDMAQRIVVMYAGEIVEEGKISQEKDAMHPYSRALFELIPDINAEARDFKIIPGEVPDMTTKENKCRFFGRCATAKPKCGTMHPEYEKVKEGHAVRCFYPVKD